MKNFFILFLILFCRNIYSQNLTLDELITLKKNNLAEVEEYLTNKGWEFISSQEGTDTTMNAASFAHNKHNYNDKAESFISYYYSDDKETKRISVQISNKEKYNNYLSRLKILGCKIIDSDVHEDEVRKVYQGATTTFIVTITIQKNDYASTSTVYNIFIISNFDYLINFAND